MSLAVAGSVATDHLMSYGGRFADSIVADQLDRLSVSFLVDDLQVRRGGVAANICFGLGQLGLRPALLAAVGNDFADYRSWLERHGVDCGSIHESSTQLTARFLCTTDTDQCQIASFFPGAMSEAREVEVQPLVDRLGTPDLFVVSPDDPDSMVRHAQECRQRGIPFAADPSQQLAFMQGPAIREVVEGARILFGNDYESSMLKEKTGWSDAEVLERVQMRVTTQGAAGARIEMSDGTTLDVPVPPDAKVVEPTGVGDAFRAGFLAADSWGLSPERAAQLGHLMASLALATVGTQEYELDRAALVARLGEVYGEQAAAEVAEHLPIA